MERCDLRLATKYYATLDFDSLEMYIVCPCRFHWRFVHFSRIEMGNYIQPRVLRRFSCCVGDFALSSSHFHSGCLPLQHGQGKHLLPGLVLRAFLGEHGPGSSCSGEKYLTASFDFAFFNLWLLRHRSPIGFSFSFEPIGKINTRSSQHFFYYCVHEPLLAKICGSL